MSLPVTRLILLFCVIVWGWTFVATKIALGYLSPFELVGIRFLIGLPLLMIVIAAKRIRIVLERGQVRPMAVGALIFLAHFLVQAYALNHTTATNTGWIIAVTPLALAALSFLILKEKLGKNEIAGIAGATLGIVLLVSHGKLAAVGWLKSTGDWLVLLSAHTWALYTIATRDLARSMNPLAVTFWVFLPLTIVCALFVFLTSHISTFTSLPSLAIGALVFLGVLGTLTQWFWQEAVARLGAAKAGIFLYVEPLATTALAVPLLGETYGLFTAVGGAMVLAGVWWAQLRGRSVL